MEQLNQFPHPDLLVEDRQFITITIDLNPLSAYSEKDGIILDNYLKEASQLTDKLEKEWQNQVAEVKNNARTILTGSGSLVLYITKDNSFYYQVEGPVVNGIVLGPAPYLKPLIEQFQFTSEYHLLVLNQDQARLFELEMSSLNEIKDETWPISLTQALGDEIVGGELNHSSFGGQEGNGQHSFHGHNDTSNEKEIDRNNFFRFVNASLIEYFGQEENNETILYALPENQAAYRAINKYKGLMDSGIEQSAAKISDEEIAKQAQAFISGIKTNNLSDLVNRFNETSLEFKVENNLEEIKTLAFENRIAELLIVKDGQGNYLVTGNDNDKAIDLRLIVVEVLKSSGKIYVITEDEAAEGLTISARTRY
ncbi:baeRF6 domain-containing protein [Streptococcus hongkongensis]|nr:hypothetical protein NC01_10040 [Streptococcus uberis]